MRQEKTVGSQRQFEITWNVKRLMKAEVLSEFKRLFAAKQ